MNDSDIKEILDLIIEKGILSDEMIAYSVDENGKKIFTDEQYFKYQKVTDYIIDIGLNGNLGRWFCGYERSGIEEYIKWIEYNGKIIEVSLVYGQGAETVSRVIEKASECFTDITARKHTYGRFNLIKDTDVIALLPEDDIIKKVEKKIRKDSIKKFLGWNNANIDFYSGHNFDLYEAYLSWKA